MSSCCSCEGRVRILRIRRDSLISGLLLMCMMALADRCVSAEPSIERVTIFEEGRDGFTLYRIPGIVVTMRGSVLAYCEARKFSAADRGEIAIWDAGEPNVAELADGRVLLTARNGDPRSRRVSVISPNGASDWSSPRFIDELYEPGCMAGMVSHSGITDSGGPLLLFSNAQTTERAHSSRRNLTIHLSCDGGTTWPVSRILEPGPSAYSDLAILPDGHVLCCFEDGSGPPVQKRKRDWAYTRITLARFNLEWLLQSGSAP